MTTNRHFWDVKTLLFWLTAVNVQTNKMLISDVVFMFLWDFCDQSWKHCSQIFAWEYTLIKYWYTLFADISTYSTAVRWKGGMIQATSGKNKLTMFPVYVCFYFCLPALSVFCLTWVLSPSMKEDVWTCLFCFGQRHANQFFHHIHNLKLMQVCVCVCQCLHAWVKH